MKKLMIITGLAALSASFSTQACPNLEGDYICRGAGQVQEVQIQQDKRNDVWTYYLDLGDDELTVLTDGKTYNLGSFQRIQNASYNATCESNTLNVNASGDISVVGRTINAQSQMSFKPASNGRITSSATLTVGGRTVQKVKLDCRPL